MGNHRADDYFSGQKQNGNPSANRPQAINNDQRWTNPVSTEVAPVISGAGFLIKETNSLRAELERNRQRAVAAMNRMKAAASAKAKFFEDVADMAERDLDETKAFHDALGL